MRPSNFTKHVTMKQIESGYKSLVEFFSNSQIDLARRGDPNSGRNHVLACRSDPASPMWTKIERLDPMNKLVKAFLKFSKKRSNLMRNLSKIRVWLLTLNRKSDQYKITYGHALYPYNMSCIKNFIT